MDGNESLSPFPFTRIGIRHSIKTRRTGSGRALCSRSRPCPSLFCRSSSISIHSIRSGTDGNPRSSERYLPTRNATVIALLGGPALLAIAAGIVFLKRARARDGFLPEEFAFAAAWVFIVGSLVWLAAFLAGSGVLGFSGPWALLTAAHFAIAGFGALTVTAFSCRMVSNPAALKILRALLLVHPIAYVTIAGGILGFRFCNEAGSAGYGIIFVTQFCAVVCGRPFRIARGPGVLALIALSVPVATMVPALAWAWGVPILDLRGMIRYHGLANAIGHVGLGLAAFAWGRPASQASLPGKVHRLP
jgi:hypothetical protein